MDNIDFAVLSKIQDLTNRFGLKPYELLATLDRSGNEPIIGMGVKFDIMTDHARTDSEFDSIESRASALLKAIGVDHDNTIGGGEKAVIDALDAALQKSPKPIGKR